MDQEKIDAIKLVQEDGMELEFLSEEFQDDDDIVFAAVRENGCAALYASRRLWRDKEFVLLALETYESDVYDEFSILSMVSKELHNDRDIIIAAAQGLHHNVLEYASENICNDREVVLISVNYFGTSLKYASVSLRADKEVVLAAVQKNPWSLKYASENLRADKEVVLAAVQTDGYILGGLSKEMRSDEEIVLASVFQNAVFLDFATKKLRNDEYFLSRLNKIKKLTIYSEHFKYISEPIQEEIRKNPDYLLNFEPVYLKPAVK
jgi:hypothetical protein